METVTLVLMLLAVATAHPYSPYTDHKGESKNVQLSDEAVAAYLKTKMEEEKLEPAKIMDYVEALLQGGKKSGSKNANVPCVTTGGNQDSLTSSNLTDIVNTLYPVTSATPYTTILTANHGINVYTGGFEPLSASSTYQVMLEQTTTTINHIWANYSPCPNCAPVLLDHFEKVSEKPTIHVARIYTESDDLSHIVLSLQCLAKLQHKGFKIVPWNFNEFKAPEGVPLFADQCITTISTAYGEANFTSTFMELERNVRFIQNIGNSTHAKSWCEV